MSWTVMLVAIVVGYALGSIPPGLVLGKALRGIDIREYGSGKIGATNVQRTLGWWPAALTLALDVAKGAGAVLAARALVIEIPPPSSDVAISLAAVAAVAGHNWPIVLGGRGGRGISPAIGAAAMLAPWAIAPAMLVGVAVIVLSDMVSLGSVTGTLVGLLAFAVGSATGWLASTYLAFALPAAVILIASHHDNLGRIIRGRERRLGLRSKVMNQKS